MKNKSRTKSGTSKEHAATPQNCENEEKYRHILENINDGCFEVDLDGNFTFLNDSVCRVLGYSREELLGMNHRHYTDKETAKKVFLEYNKVYQTGKPLEALAWQITRKDGAKRYIEGSISLQRDASGKPVGFLGIANDVTSRKEAEAALRESEEKFRVLADSTPTAIMLYQDDRWIYANRASEVLCGYSEKELLAMNFWDIVHPDYRALIRERGRKRQLGEVAPSHYEFKIITKDGQEKWAYLAGASTTMRGKTAAIITVQDISELKQAEENLRNSEERYRLVVESAHESIFITQNMKIVFVNSSAVLNTGYSMEKLLSTDFTKIIHPDDINIVVNNHIKRLNGQPVPSCYAFRIICHDGAVKWVDLNTSAIQWKNQPATLNFLKDITERKLLDEERGKSYKRTRETLEATVNTIAVIVETRDPYTTGHQLRVSHLARDIAAEMGLTHDQKEFIGTAAIIHDIGKLSIPSEILSKPTKLSMLEFELIKTHSQSGYNILKDVKFPWPVADVILQHHERIDGSGYPNNLKGKDILLEARIVAIADVVEAMASHRPYREALGIDMALQEIEKNRGIVFDAAVADACLRLFRQKNYHLT